MEWQYCSFCSKVVDEYEDKCHWCGTPKLIIEDKPKTYDKFQLKLNFGDTNER